MDVRILACVVPLAPFILVGTLMFAGLFTHSLSPSMYLGIAGYCIGLLGIGGIVMASMESTYSDARKARIAILLLLCGISAAAIGAVVLMFVSNNLMVTVGVLANPLCPVIVGLDSIRRLRLALDTDSGVSAA